MQYQKIDFVSNRSAAALYLNPDKDSPRQFLEALLITPSGATPASREPSGSWESDHIIQGPPGTGKTQTISTSWPTLWCRRRPCWSSRTTTRPSKCGQLGRDWILTALLGSRERKTAFVETQAIESIPGRDRLVVFGRNRLSEFAPFSELNRCRRFSNDRSGWPDKS